MNLFKQLKPNIDPSAKTGKRRKKLMIQVPLSEENKGQFGKETDNTFGTNKK